MCSCAAAGSSPQAGSLMHADASQSLKLRSRLPVGWVGFHAVRVPLTAVSALRTVSYGLTPELLLCYVGEGLLLTK